MATQNLFQKIWDEIKSLFDRSPDELKAIATVADNVVNAIKDAEASTIGQLIETGLEVIFPATIPLINAFRLELPRIAAIITTGKAESEKPAIEISKDLVNYLQSQKAADVDLYAGTLNTLNAKIQKFIADNQGIELPVANALAAAQVVHAAKL